MQMRSTLVLPAVLALALASRATAAEPNVPPRGFIALFNGQDMAGWHGFNDSPIKLAAMSPKERQTLLAKQTEDALQHWSVKDGDLINDGHGAYLTTDDDFGDIELLIDYKTVPRADSGIYLRATPQVQIWDWTKEGGKWNLGADKGSGGLWNNSAGAPGKDPLVRADKPFGEWNHFRIIQIGARTSVWLNDKLVVNNATMENYWDRKRPLLPKGPIQLQTHGGEIRWRNIFLRKIPPQQANALLAAGDARRFDDILTSTGEGSKAVVKDGFVPVFNGTDFTGWAGATDNYEVKDGAIRCKPHKGGVLYTKKEYGDFVVRLEYLVPPGGNNGLAIRYPGEGDTAYVGMCEIQVLDDYSPRYASLDPRQYNGSVYGIVPVQRGYERLAKQWNYEEVTVKGSTIKVELNGTVVVNADVSKVTTYMANSAHPGKDRKSGHFGFAGHSDPVQFRNIRIKELKSDSQR